MTLMRFSLSKHNYMYTINGRKHLKNILNAFMTTHTHKLMEMYQYFFILMTYINLKIYCTSGNFMCIPKLMLQYIL